MLHGPIRLPLGSRETTTHPDTPATPTPPAGTQHPSCWSDEETKALLEFLLLHRPHDKWPSTKNPQFWQSTAEFVELRGKGRVRRSGICMYMYRTLCASGGGITFALQAYINAFVHRHCMQDQSYIWTSQRVQYPIRLYNIIASPLMIGQKKPHVMSGFTKEKCQPKLSLIVARWNHTFKHYQKVNVSLQSPNFCKLCQSEV